MFSFVHAYSIIREPNMHIPTSRSFHSSNSPEAFSVFCDLRFWLMASRTNIRGAHIHGVIVAALGIRLWNGDEQAGCLWRSAPGVNTNEGVREGSRVRHRIGPIAASVNTQGSYGSRMTLQVVLNWTKVYYHWHQGKGVTLGKVAFYGWSST